MTGARQAALIALATFHELKNVVLVDDLFARAFWSWIPNPSSSPPTARSPIERGAYALGLQLRSPLLTPPAHRNINLPHPLNLGYRCPLQSGARHRAARRIAT